MKTAKNPVPSVTTIDAINNFLADIKGKGLRYRDVDEIGSHRDCCVYKIRVTRTDTVQQIVNRSAKNFGLAIEWSGQTTFKVTHFFQPSLTSNTAPVPEPTPAPELTPAPHVNPACTARVTKFGVMVMVNAATPDGFSVEQFVSDYLAGKIPTTIEV